MPAIEKFVRIFAITVPAFLARENPISRNANPACMNITRQAATITQIELIPIESGTPFLLPTASIRSARGRDMQPPWLDVLMVDFGCPSDIGQRSEMQAGVFAPRSKTAAYAAIRGVSHAGQVPARALGGIGPRLPGEGPWQRLGRGDRARARNVVLRGRRARNRGAGARRLGHQGDADGRDRGAGGEGRLLGPPTGASGAAQRGPRGEAVRGAGQPWQRAQAPLLEGLALPRLRVADALAALHAIDPVDARAVGPS